MSGDTITFNGSDSFRETHEHLQSVAGKATWMNEFKPVTYEHKHFFDRLVGEVFKFNVCCVIVGNFVAFRAGVFSSLDTVTLVIAVTNNPLFGSNFAEKRRPHNSFWFGVFKFIHESISLHFIEYNVHYEDVRFPFLVWLIETRKEC